jgi:2-polyprenyl-3-methyl-5-hydroxy-6-metoxy-1,4-benzoquinol methylase
MAKLTRKEYWDSIYKPKASCYKRNSLKGKLLENEYTRPYADYLLWDVIYKKYMPKTKGAKVLEVGSAPGTNLVRLSQTFGFVPYGIEYTDSGVELNRRIFISRNLNPDNVIAADFLSDELHKQYKGYFDIVLSAGFIEHFTDIEDVIEKHINLLKRGGCLIISIPNLRGANYILQWIFQKKIILSMVDLNIMQKKEFLKMFDKDCLSTLFCDYYGTFSFGLFNTKRNSPLHIVMTFCMILQLILNVVFRLLLGNKGVESSLFSPYLIYIGLKK